MKTELLINTAILSTLFLVLFSIGEILYHKFKISANNTRKFTHLSSALLTFSFPQYLQEPIYVFLLCASFAVLLSISKKFNLLKSINNVKRKSLGSLAFPIAVFILFSNWYYLGFNDFVLLIGTLVMGISDPIAAFIGEKWQEKNNKPTDKKSNIGSLSFFISAFILILFSYNLLGFNLIETRVFVFSIIYAAIATLAERLTPLGLDNLSIPIVLIITNLFLIG